jgi:hypothetical protein
MDTAISGLGNSGMSERMVYLSTEITMSDIE